MKRSLNEFEPIKTFRTGNVEVAIWTTEDAPDGAPDFSIRVARVYRADCEAKFSNLFTPDELLHLFVMAADAHYWIEKKKKENQQNKDS